MKNDGTRFSPVRGGSRSTPLARRTLAASLVATASLGVACSSAPGESVGTVSSASTFANDQPAYDYFVGKGLTPFQAAGIVGNLDQESGVDPTSVEYGGGPGRGIAQWSVGGRWDTDANDNATSYAQQQGLALLSLQLQLDFIWYELTTFSSYGLAALQASTNVTDATVAFQTDFEGCGTCDQSQRVAYAENVLAVFGSTDAGGGEDAATSCTVTTTGVSGVCLDTSVCASMAGHASTPGYCPGASDIECCTATATSDAGGSEKKDAGNETTDAATVHHGDAASTVDAAGKGEVLDAGPGGEKVDGDVEAHGIPGAATPGSGGGCSVASSGSEASSSNAASWAPWLALLAWAQARRRRRRAPTA